MSRFVVAFARLGWAGALVWSVAQSWAAPLELHARSQQLVAPNSEEWRTVEQVLRWDGTKTAIVICDMWDQHWCQGATARVAEMAPRMNDVLRAARARGVLIIHAPSDTMKFYAEYPQRQRAQRAPPAASPPPEVGRWKSLNPAREGPLPIDDSDGGCDDAPRCAQGGPWRRQIATLEVRDEDVISDSGAEIYNLLAQLGIEQVIVMGVHTNMCVLGRSFAIRSLVGWGKRVVLMRDLTDTMYNSRRRPYVSHFVGTDLVIGHIERYWCPTVTSADFLGGEPFRFSADRRPTVAFIVGENEYRTWESLPEFARQELAWRGFQTVWVTASPRLEDWQFERYEALGSADVVVVSARRRALPRPMLALLRQHLEAGKPLVGIRTASHAFAVRGSLRDRLGQDTPFAEWPEFDAEVLGGNYSGHHAANALTRLSAAEGAATSPLLVGVPLEGFASPGSLYRTGPLQPGAKALLVGAIPGQPPEPVAWTHAYGANQAKVFYTSLGHLEDFKNPRFRRLLLNALCWAIERPIPPAE